MKIDVTQVFVHMNGKPVKEGFCQICGRGDENARDLTLRSVITSALTLSIERDPISMDEHAKRYMLALKVQASDEVDLTMDEGVLIKNLVAKMRVTLVSGQVHMMLEDIDIPRVKRGNKASS